MIVVQPILKIHTCTWYCNCIFFSLHTSCAPCSDLDLPFIFARQIKASRHAQHHTDMMEYRSMEWLMILLHMPSSTAWDTITSFNASLRLFFQTIHHSGKLLFQKTWSIQTVGHLNDLKPFSIPSQRSIWHDEPISISLPASAAFICHNKEAAAEALKLDRVFSAVVFLISMLLDLLPEPNDCGFFSC